MKRLCAFLLSTALCISLLRMPTSASNHSIDRGGGSGEFYRIVDTAPFINSDRTFLPIRFVTETFGIFTAWDNVAKTVTLGRGTTSVSLTIGSKTMTLTKNGLTSSVEMDVAPMIKDGRTCLPVRFVAEAFGLIVEWKTDWLKYRQAVIITEIAWKHQENYKALYLGIGDTEIMVVAGHFLKFYENDRFRFAYPLYPECVDLSEGNTISFYSEPWLGLDRIITVTHESVVGTPFANMDLDSAIIHIGEQYMTAVTKEPATVDEIPAVAYRLRPEDGHPRSGIAFFHNGMLLRFEVSIPVEETEFDKVPDESAFSTAEALLYELLPTLTMK